MPGDYLIVGVVIVFLIVALGLGSYMASPAGGLRIPQMIIEGGGSSGGRGLPFNQTSGTLCEDAENLIGFHWN